MLLRIISSLFSDWKRGDKRMWTVLTPVYCSSYNENLGQELLNCCTVNLRGSNLLFITYGVVMENLSGDFQIPGCLIFKQIT